MSNHRPYTNAGGKKAARPSDHNKGKLPAPSKGLPSLSGDKWNKPSLSPYSRPGAPTKAVVKSLEKALRKQYVLDTNVLIDDPQCILAFKEHDVIIPLVVVEELDRKKKELPTARQAIALLEKLGVSDKFLSLESGGRIRISKGEPGDGERMNLPSSNDNRIIGTAIRYHTLNLEQKTYQSVTLVSNDINVRVKANVFGVAAEAYLTNEAEVKDMKMPRIIVKENELQELGFFDRDKPVLPVTSMMQAVLEKHDIRQNDGFVVQLNEDPSSAQGTLVYKNGVLKKVDDTNCNVYHNGWVRPFIPQYYAKTLKFNPGHEVFLEHLMDEDICFIACHGKAGTGKTMTAISAALKLVLEDHQYERIVITRPNVASGNEIGHLPGDKATKMDPWIAPIRDHIIAILSKKGEKGGKRDKLDPTEDPSSPWHGKSRSGQKNSESKGSSQLKSGREKFDQLVADGIIEIEATTFVRGRSFENCVVIVDEGQNMSQLEGKTWITRIGVNAKLIMLGDLDQIDNPFLRKGNNALAVLSAKTRGQSWAATVVLEYGVRSVISDWAAWNL